MWGFVRLPSNIIVSECPLAHTVAKNGQILFSFVVCVTDTLLPYDLSLGVWLLASLSWKSFSCQPLPSSAFVPVTVLLLDGDGWGPKVQCSPECPACPLKTVPQWVSMLQSRYDNLFFFLIPCILACLPCY